jgi:hypothetical protein
MTMVSSMAQVYSVNIVGYINHTIPAGWSMFAAQLVNTPDNNVVTLFANAAVPENTAVYKFVRSTGGYDSITFVDGAWEGDDLDMTLVPGEGVFVFAPAPFTVTLVGEVLKLSSVSIDPGFSIVSSVVPQNEVALTGENGLGFPVGENDAIYQFDAASGGYVANSFVDNAWEGDSGGDAPAPKIAEAFFVFNAGAQKTWNRDFQVN